MNISNQRVRLAIDTSQMGSITDVITGLQPQFWNGVDVEFELAIFYGSVLAAVNNFDSITVDVKLADPRTGLPVMSQTIASGSLNNSLTLAAWQGGAPADCHCLASFTHSESNLNLGSSDTVTFWLVVSAITATAPATKSSSAPHPSPSRKAAPESARPPAWPHPRTIPPRNPTRGTR